jgi:nucleoside-diphosphate-sugar epimerase
VVCDILDLDKLCSIVSRYQPDIVVHLAARTDLDENEDLEGYAANSRGTKNLVQAIVNAGSVSRALFTSSQLVCRVGYIPRSDTDYKPSNLYGESKVLTEKVVRESRLSSITWCILRPTTIWGEGMSAHYQRFLGMVKNGRFVHIGRKPLYKSYGYIGNAIHQYRCFIEAPDSLIHGKTFYIADYEPLSLREWVDSLASEFGGRTIKTMPISVARAAAWMGDVVNRVGFNGFPFNSFRLNNILTEYTFDMSSTENVCGPLPFTVKEGVSRTAGWFTRLSQA